MINTNDLKSLHQMRSTRSTILLTVVLLMGMTTPALSQTWLSGYGYRMELSTDTAVITGLGTLPDFPILINITESKLRHTSYSGHVTSITGADITFTNPDGTTPLSFQIEKYDSSTGELIAYVNISNFSTFSTASIFIYYGNASVTTSPASSATWDSDFVGVWHLHDNFNDGTSNALNGTNGGSTNYSPGASGDGQEIDPLYGHYIGCGLQPKLQIAGDLTLEVWANYSILWSGSMYNHFVSTTAKGAQDIYDKNYFFRINYDKKLVLHWDYSGNNKTEDIFSTVAASVGTNAWHHYAVTRDSIAKEVIFYVDGVQLGVPVSYTNQASGGSVTEFQIGTAKENFNYSFDGRVDEVRVSSSVRSSSWIEATFIAINNSSALISVGTEQNDTTFYTTGSGAWSSTTVWNVVPGYTIDSNIIIEVNDTITMDGNVIIEGTLTIDSAATLSGAGYDITISPGGSLINHGILNLDNLTNQGSFINNNDVSVVYTGGLTGALINTDSLINNGTITSYTIDNTNGVIVNNDSLTTNNNFTNDTGVIVYNNMATIHGHFYNKYGAVQDNNVMTVDSSMDNYFGNFINNNILSIGVDFYNQHGTITNNGLMTVNNFFSNTNGYMDGTMGDYDIDGQLNNTNGNIDGTVYLDVCNSDGMTLNLVGSGTINWATVTVCGSILPIDLVVFNARQHGSNILVQWTTSSEIGNAHFIIEKSIDGQHFERIGRVIGAGDSYFVVEYHFADTHPTKGICYYRLTQVDINGNERTFKMHAVYYQPENTFSVFPNPSDGKMIYLDLNHTSNNILDDIKISLTAVNGDILAHHIKYVNNGNLLTLTETKYDLAPGMYFIIVHSDNGVYREKLIVY